VPYTAFVGLGSNIGDKEDNLKKALDLLNSCPGVRVKKVSSFYRTAPLGYTRQDWFLNAAAELETGLSPHELLSVLLDVERKLGRERGVRWGPRTVDLDLLVFGAEEIKTPGLTVPHPRMGERAFVMVPLAEIAPELVLPGRGTASELAGQLAKRQAISKYPAAVWVPEKVWDHSPI